MDQGQHEHGQDDAQDMPSVPVHVPRPLDTQPQAADFGGWSSYSLAGTEQPQPVLPFDTYRHRAVIKVNGPVTAGGQSSSTATGSSTGPASGAIITQLALKQGLYTVSWQLMYGGTTAAAETNNMALDLFGIRGLATAVIPSTAGGPVPQQPVQVSIPAGGATVTVQAVNAGTGTAVYNAQIDATPAAASASPGFVYIGTQAQCQQKLGGVLAVGEQVAIENNQQLWMAPDGADPVVVSVLAERWDSGS